MMSTRPPREKCNFVCFSPIQFEVRGKEIVITPLLPISAYYGMLKGYDLGDIEPPKEPDKDHP